MTLLLVLHTLLAGGLGACVYLYLLGKSELRAAEKRSAKLHGAAEAQLDKFRAELEVLRERLRETEENAGLLVAPQPARSGLNLGKRSQAIRLFRRGDKPAQIAAALHLPQREVELLVKVHRIVLNAPLGDAKLTS
jgi:hypothetical protein